MNVGLVGAGCIGHIRARALEDHPRCRLSAVADMDQARARVVAGRANVAVFSQYRDLLAHPHIDAVVVSTPPQFHEEIVTAALESGKHVMCEKPLSSSVDACRRMVAMANRTRMTLATGFNHRYFPAIQFVKQALNSGAIGELDHVRAFAGHTGLSEFRSPWEYDPKIMGGGALMDVGIYALQGTRYVSGEEPTEVFAIETKTDKVKFKEVDESILWSMRFPSGLVANCATTYLVNGMNRLFAAAENGWFQLDPAYSYGGLKGRTSKAEMDFPQVDHFAAEMDDFANCIINNKPSRVPGEEGLRDVKIMTAIYDSIRSGRPVKLR